jgi:outer membrane protein TolC
MRFFPLLFVVHAVAAFAPLAASAQAPLTLAEAERLALAHAPWYAHHRTNVTAAAERTVYEGRLPDPQLTVGALNVPSDSWKLDQEDMTMLMVGVRQAFPPGDTLAQRTHRAEQELKREEARLEIERRNLLREVRRTWLELYYAGAALRNVEATRPLLERQLTAAEGRYRAAQDSQVAVLRARQALARLDDRAAELHAGERRMRAMLARWIGDAAQAPLPDSPPALPPPAEPFDVEHHPDALAARAGLEAARAEVAMARAEYRPGIMLDVQYGFRRTSPDGMERPDLVTAMLTFDLPIFRDKRQDRRLAEKQTMESGASFELEDKRRELAAAHAAARAEHEALAERVRLYEERILPPARTAARLTIAGFAREQTELRDARMQELEAELELTRLRVELARSQTELLYLTGESQP